jgi:ABC-type branched-subunit amino acid transport system ATPase component
MSTLLEASGLARSFGGVKAVNDVSFTVTRGEVLGIAGANGSGKTTVLNLLTRLVDVSAGDMVLDGKSYRSFGAHRLARLGIARTFQNLRLFDTLTTRENLQLAARAGSARGSQGLSAESAMERAGVTDLAKLLPGELPYGTQRVIEILRTLVSQPRLVFLDEPFAGMSIDEAKQVGALLDDFRSDHDLTLVVVDHNMEVMVELVDRMLIMNEGRIIAEGDPKAVLTEDAVVESYLGADDD